MPQRILALETSALAGSVALLDGPDIVAERLLAPGQRSAQSLAPAIAEVLAAAGVAAGAIELVAVTTGPGSFTGLRVGTTTAKMFAYAVGAAAVGVDTLDVLARQAPVEGERLWTLVDAHRGELFAAEFGLEGGCWRRRSPNQIVARDAWIAMLRPGDVVTGPIVAKLGQDLPSGVAVEQAHFEPRASTVGVLGFEAFAAGRRDDLAALAPNYGRPSAAEEKRRSAAASQDG